MQAVTQLSTSSCFDEAFEGDTNRERGKEPSLQGLMMKLLAGLGIIFQDLSWFELRPLQIAELQHPVHELLGAGDVQHAERTAQERRESDAEHRTDIS